MHCSFDVSDIRASLDWAFRQLRTSTRHHRQREAFLRELAELVSGRATTKDAFICLGFWTVYEVRPFIDKRSFDSGVNAVWALRITGASVSESWSTSAFNKIFHTEITTECRAKKCVYVCVCARACLKSEPTASEMVPLKIRRSYVMGSTTDGLHTNAATRGKQESFFS